MIKKNGRKNKWKRMKKNISAQSGEDWQSIIETWYSNYDRHDDLSII